MGWESIALAVGGALLSQSMQQDAPSQPAAPPAIEPPPQAAKAPSQPALKRKNAATALTGPMSGAAGTMLTGPSGIPDSMLNLGKNDKLGQ